MILTVQGDDNYDLRPILARHAKRYSSSETTQKAIIDRTLMIVAHDECFVETKTLDRALFSVLHRVALQQISQPSRDLKPTVDLADPALGRVLDGKTILVAENEYFLAEEISAALQENGAKIAGPFPGTDEALNYLKKSVVDAALLDIHLANGRCFQLADTFLELETPIVFLSGYDASTVPSRFNGVPFYQKPATPDQIVSMVALCLLR